MYEGGAGGSRERDSFLPPGLAAELEQQNSAQREQQQSSSQSVQQQSSSQSVQPQSSVERMNLLSLARGYTITLSAPPKDQTGTSQADPVSRRSSQVSEELLPPQGYVADVPLSRTESRFPSLDDVAHDSKLREWLGSVGAHVDVQTALQMEEPKLRCEALNALVKKSVEDKEWAEGLASDGPTLGTIVQWGRRQMQQVYTDLRKSTGSPKISTENATSPADSVACLSVALRLLAGLCVISPRCVVHLVDAGMHDTLVFRIEELPRVLALAKDSVSPAEWRDTEMSKLPKRIVNLLTNLATGNVTTQRLWLNSSIPDVLTNILDLLPDDPSAVFAFLHKLTVNLPDENILTWLESSEGCTTIRSYYQAALHKARVSSTGPIDFDSVELDEWVLIFSSRIWLRKRGALFPSLFRDILFLTPRLGSTAAFFYTPGESGNPPAYASETNQSVGAYMLRILEEILEFERNKGETIRAAKAPASETAVEPPSPTYDQQSKLLEPSLYSPEFQDMYLCVMSEYLMWLNKKLSLPMDPKPQRVETKGPLGQIFSNGEKGSTVQLEWPIFRQMVRVLVVVSGSVTSVRSVENRQAMNGEEQTEGKRPFSDATGGQLIGMCVTVLKALAEVKVQKALGNEISGARMIERALSCKDFLLLCANLLYENKEAQNILFDTDGMRTLMCHAHTDVNEPLKREAAIFAIRNASKDHQQNQAVLNGFLSGEFKGVIGGLDQILAAKAPQ